ncbi:hypothetical protein [Streptomyces acidiscabies]|uniref:hypothetical protein n=1 Tax=Streptomyces acidiscabies TaxID=42234 RepID=UPI0038F67028
MNPSDNTPHTTQSCPPSFGPGKRMIRETLGKKDHTRLKHLRDEPGTPLGALADLVATTAEEADRLHTALRRQADEVRLRLSDVLDPYIRSDLRTIGYATDLHVVRFTQQMKQLALVLEVYQTAVRDLPSVTEGTAANGTHRDAASTLLTETRADLSTRATGTTENLHSTLSRLVTELYFNDRLGDGPLSLGRIVDEAAARLLNQADPKRLALPHDNDLAARLTTLDGLPMPELLLLLDAATHHPRT